MQLVRIDPAHPGGEIAPVDLVDPLRITPAEAEAAAELDGGDLASNTRRTYASAWRTFLKWWVARQISAGVAPSRPEFPFPKELVVAYVVHRTSLMLSPAQLDVDLRALRRAHQKAPQGDLSDAFDAIATSVRKLLAGYRRTPQAAASKRGKASAVLAQHLKRIVHVADGVAPGGFAADEPEAVVARDRAMILVGWAGAFRRSEVAALRLGDLDFTSTTDAVVVTIQKSKTDQRRAGQTVVLHAAQDENATICPVRALRAWIRTRAAIVGRTPWIAGATDDEDLAAWNSGLGWLWVAFTPTELVRRRSLADESGVDSALPALVLQHRAAQAKIELPRVSGHSMRRGWITEAAVAGVSPTDIMVQSRHASLAEVAGYIDEATRMQRVPRLI